MTPEQLLARRMAYSAFYTTPEAIPFLEDVVFPRPITSMHQIEITSRCNLRCAYCPNRKMPKAENIAARKEVGSFYERTSPVDFSYRQQLDMTERHFVRALGWVEHFVNRKTQVEVNLAGIGESTMHPQFVEFVGMAREAIGDGVISLATNGLLVDEAMCKAIAPYRPQVWVSLHRPEKAGPAIVLLKKHGIYASHSNHPATDANDWAGQVEWFNSARHSTACQWQREGFVMAMADGRVTSCCLDAKGAGVIGHLDDAIPTVKQQPYSLCETCQQHIRCRGE